LDCIGQSEGSKELARKVSTNQRAKRNWRVNVGQSESRQKRARKSANQSACRNRANADQSERREEPARKYKVSQSEHLQEPRECRPIRALAGTCCARTSALTKTKATDTKNNHRSAENIL